MVLAGSLLPDGLSYTEGPAMAGSNKRQMPCQVNVRLHEEERDQLALLAQAQGVRPGTLARTVLTRYIKQATKRGTTTSNAAT